MHSILDEIKIQSALDYVDGSADRSGAILDMAGYAGVLMVVKFGTIAASAVTTIKAQQDSDSAGGTMADLADTAISVADDDDNQIFIIDIFRPAERYVRLMVDKDAAHNTAEMAWYLQYGANQLPVANAVANAVTYEQHVSPAEGTA